MADQIQMQPELVRGTLQQLTALADRLEQQGNGYAAALEAAAAGDPRGYLQGGISQGQAALQRGRAAIAKARELIALTEVTWQQVEEADQQSPVNELETAPPATQETQAPSVGKQALSVGADFTPVLGELKGFAEIFTGTDLVTGEDLGWWRFAGLLGLIGLNEVKHLRHAGKLGDLAKGLRRAGEGAQSINRFAEAARRASHADAAFPGIRSDAASRVAQSVKLNRHQRELLQQLRKSGDSVLLAKKQVRVGDMIKLSAHEEVEFALFTRGGQRVLMRGERTSVPFTPGMAKKWAQRGWRWTGHTHPHGRNMRLEPSGLVVGSDQGVLWRFAQYGRQKYSAVYDWDGRFRLFRYNEGGFGPADWGKVVEP